MTSVRRGPGPRARPQARFARGRFLGTFRARMFRIVGVWGVWGTLVGVAGCESRVIPCGTDAAMDSTSDGGAEAGLDAGGANLVEEFMRDLAKASCAWQFSCCSLPEIDLLGSGAYLTESDCHWYMELALRARFSDVRASAAEGRMSIDPVAAKACLDAFDEDRCAPPGQILDPGVLLDTCRDPFVGGVASGQRCFVSNECASGSVCVNSSSFDDGTIPLTNQGLSALRSVSGIFPVLGTCVPYLAKGDRCRNSTECAPTLYCSRPAFVCAAPAGELQECLTELDPSGEQRTAIACDDATRLLACGRDGLCRRLPRQSEPCSETSPFLCDPDPNLVLSCVGSGFNGPGVCKPAGTSGAACGPDGLAPCANGLACLAVGEVDDVGVCGSLPKEGEDCTLGWRCIPPAVCDLANAKCARPGRGLDGDSCVIDKDCASLTCRVEGVGPRGVCFAPDDFGVWCAGAGNSPVAGSTADPLP